jgi:hypothetical protein
MIITHNGTILKHDGTILTKITEVPPQPPFTNTYSLEFDGVDDRVQLSSDFVASGEFTISFWMKPVSAGSPISEIYPIGTFPNNDNYVKLDQIGVVWLRLGASNVIFNESVYGGGSNNLVLDTWQHIAFIRDSSNIIRCYRNGVDFGYNVANPANSNTLTLNSFGRIITNTFGYEGGLDEITLFQTDETANISTLSTSPTVDLTDLSPTVWLRNGDNGSYKSPQWLIPNNENKDKVSNYSFEFDGVNDYVSIPTITLATDFSVSMWLKATTSGNARDQVFGGPSGFFLFGTVVYDGGLLANKMCYYNGASNVALTPTLRDGNWHNIVITYNSSATNLIAYTDGVETYNATYDAGTNNVINRISEDTYGNHWKGNLDELAVWTSELSQSDVTSIYGGGVPSSLPSGAIAHYKMGEDSTFAGGVWTVPDSVGSNDGTSVNMTIEDRVGEAPNSTNNALSFNMDLVDRTTDVPT